VGRPGTFKKGTPKPPNSGRKKGSLNRATIERNLLTRAADWINGQPYFDNVKRRVERGKAPHMETYFARRIHGREVDADGEVGNDRRPVKIVIEVVRND
jgi:hypothetical protein